MREHLLSAEAVVEHYQMEAVSSLTLWSIEIDIQELAREFANNSLQMCAADCETLAALYRLRQNLRVSLESDRQRENNIEKAIYSRFAHN